MKRCFVVAAAAVVALACASEAAAVFHPPSKLIVLGKSVGGVALGDSRAKAIGTWGAPDRCQSGGGGFNCEYNQDEISFAGGKQGISSIDVLAANLGFHTSKGIHIGSTVQQLKQAYPGLRRQPKFDRPYYMVNEKTSAVTFFLVGQKQAPSSSPNPPPPTGPPIVTSIQISHATRKH